MGKRTQAKKREAQELVDRWNRMHGTDGKGAQVRFVDDPERITITRSHAFEETGVPKILVYGEGAPVRLDKLEAATYVEAVGKMPLPSRDLSDDAAAALERGRRVRS